MNVAIVHDYLTQRGGAERVVLSMTKAFPDAPIHTAFYEPAATFSEFADARIVTLPLNRLGPFRQHHRAALPLLAPAFSRHRVEADVVLCSSSGWAQGVAAVGKKVVYCYSPARWLYDGRRYLGGRRPVAGPSLAALRPWLVRWDRRAAASADRYLTLSTVVRQRILNTYGIEAEVVPAPFGLTPDGPRQPVPAVEPGFFLCVARLLPYKNVGAVVEAFSGLPSFRLVVVGDGPERSRLATSLPANVSLLGPCSDPQLRWLYASSSAVVAAAHEDYGLTPLEGAAFGKPAAVLRWGGFLDTVVDGVTGVFFASPDPDVIRDAVRAVSEARWSSDTLRTHADRFSERRFVARMREIIAQEATGAD